MTSYEIYQALVTLTNELSYLRERNWTQDSKMINALDTAIKVLKKEYPAKAPKTVTYNCPNCHEDISPQAERCGNCGQVIEWKEEENESRIL